MTCPSVESLAEWLEHDGALREHIDGCAQCGREVAKLRALTAQLARLTLAAPDAAFSGEVSARLTSSRRFPSASWAAAAVVAACALLLWWRPHAPSAFRARGGESAAAARVGFEVRVHTQGSSPVLLTESCIAADSGYSFTVFNRTQRSQFLMLFARDARGEVHWFYPAYLDAHEDPRSIAISATPESQNLPDGVTPEAVAPGQLQFVALFSRSPLTVSEIEARLRKAGLAALRGSDAGTVLQVTSAQVCR